MLFKYASYNLMLFTYPLSADVKHKCAFGRQFANQSLCSLYGCRSYLRSRVGTSSTFPIS